MTINFLKEKSLSLADLKSLLTYNPATGILIRNKSCRGRHGGSVMGGISSGGYHSLSINGFRYAAHRIVRHSFTSTVNASHPRRLLARSSWKSSTEIRQCDFSSRGGVESPYREIIASKAATPGKTSLTRLAGLAPGPRETIRQCDLTAPLPPQRAALFPLVGMARCRTLRQ